MCQNLKEENERLKAYIKKLEKNVDALRSTIFDLCVYDMVEVDELKDLLIEERDENFIIENFPDWAELQEEEEEEEEEEK